jgi:polyisoprenoid-binding protein YceI
VSRSLFATAALLLAAGAAHAQPAVYAFDVQHSFVQFEVMHFGTSTIRGRIGPALGEAVLDPAAGSGSVSLRIPTASVDTGVPAMDAKLREPDLLDAQTHPEAFFVGSRVRFDDAGRLAEVRGELTLRGTSRPLALHAIRFGCHSHPLLKREVCGGDFEAELKRSEFGATFGLPFVADRVRLVIQVEGIRR